MDPEGNDVIINDLTDSEAPDPSLYDMASLMEYPSDDSSSGDIPILLADADVFISTDSIVTEISFYG